VDVDEVETHEELLSVMPPPPAPTSSAHNFNSASGDTKKTPLQERSGSSKRRPLTSDSDSTNDTNSAACIAWKKRVRTSKTAVTDTNVKPGEQMTLEQLHERWSAESPSTTTSTKNDMHHLKSAITKCELAIKDLVITTKDISDRCKATHEKAPASVLASIDSLANSVGVEIRKIRSEVLTREQLIKLINSKVSELEFSVCSGLKDAVLDLLINNNKVKDAITGNSDSKRSNTDGVMNSVGDDASSSGQLVDEDEPMAVSTNHGTVATKERTVTVTGMVPVLALEHDLLKGAGRHQLKYSDGTTKSVVDKCTSTKKLMNLLVDSDEGVITGACFERCDIAKEVTYEFNKIAAGQPIVVQGSRMKALAAVKANTYHMNFLQKSRLVFDNDSIKSTLMSSSGSMSTVDTPYDWLRKPNYLNLCGGNSSGHYSDIIPAVGGSGGAGKEAWHDIEHKTPEREAQDASFDAWCASNSASNTGGSNGHQNSYDSGHQRGQYQARGQRGGGFIARQNRGGRNWRGERGNTRGHNRGGGVYNNNSGAGFSGGPGSGGSGNDNLTQALARALDAVSRGRST
jgi:hypothetical protein